MTPELAKKAGSPLTSQRLEPAPENRFLKRLIWAYFFLLILEGALRRWILPGLAGPLLLIRDPVAIAMILVALGSGRLRVTGLLLVTFVTAFLSFLLTFLVGHGNLFVAVYGVRIYLLHVPLLFIIGATFTHDDVLKVGRVICLLSLPMTALVAAQFFLPQTHLVNIGIGGEGTAGFSGTVERFRPPGTFSFITGLTEFYTIVAAMIAGFALQPRAARKWWWSASAVCLVLAVPFSISRGLLFSVIIVGICFVIVGLGKSELTGRFLGATAALCLLFALGTMIPAFESGVTAFASRWTVANEAEGGLEGVMMDRFLGGLWSALMGTQHLPMAGLGMGLGTNAGAQMMVGYRAFSISEGDWGRIMGEMGPVLGFIIIGVRLVLAWTMVEAALRSWRAGQPLALLLASVTVLWVAQGTWAQPTSLGFAIFGGGLTLAAARRSAIVQPPVTLARTAPELPGPIRARSRYAEKLHDE